MALTPKQQRFVSEYLIDLNAAAAYRRAGYTAKNDNVAAVEGHRLLSNPKIQGAIAAAQVSRAQRTELTQDWVIRRMRREATRYGEGASHSARVRALELLGKHQGLFPDRHQVEGGLTMELVEEIVDAPTSTHHTNGQAPSRATSLPPQ